MRKAPPQALEGFRIWGGKYGSKPGEMYGSFIIEAIDGKMIIMSSGSDRVYGWEHVSVSFSTRSPTWEEMCWVKNMFWEENEVVVQYHPAKKDYVNHHPHCLHLWRSMRRPLRTPPTILVGPRETNDNETPSDNVRPAPDIDWKR
jgi:hypothetical protein